MKLRIAIAVAVGVVVGTLGTLGTTVTAQRETRVPAVTTPNGFIVEEVRVGDSCVVVVTRGASGLRGRCALFGPQRACPLTRAS